MKPPTIRAFIAVELSPPIRATLEEVIGLLQRQLPERAVRWVRPEQMHLTLRFLGETAVEQLPLLAQLLDKIAAQQRPFILQLGQAGCFPSRQRPRVVWLGLEGAVPALINLQKGVESGLLPLGWAQEQRPFQPHLTLGRVQEGRQLPGANWQVDMARLVGEKRFTVTAVHLIQSTLRPNGAVYTLRHTSHLTK